MAQITCTYGEAVDLPSLGLVAEPGETLTVPDDTAADLVASGWFTSAQPPQDDESPATAGDPAAPIAPHPAPLSDTAS